MKGEAAVSEPVLSADTGNVILVVAQPVYDDNSQLVGVVGGTIPTEYIESLLVDVQMGETGEAYQINTDGYFLTPSRFEDRLKADGLIKERSELELADRQPGFRRYPGRERWQW